MPWKKPRRNWKAMHPTRLEDAFHLCKEHARETKRLSVDRLSELMGVKPSLLYKWMEDGAMPTGRIAAFEHICGAHFVSEYLCAGTGRLVIDVAAGRPVDEIEIIELQALCAEAVATLVRCGWGEASAEDTEDKLLDAIRGLSWHRQNIEKMEQPEIDLDEVN